MKKSPRYEGAGQVGGLEQDLPPDISSALEHQDRVDSRLPSLLAAAIRFDSGR